MRPARSCGLSGSSRRTKINPSDIEKIVAKMAKIPPQSVSTSDKVKLEKLALAFETGGLRAG